jgi:hypothetical protein
MRVNVSVWSSARCGADYRGASLQDREAQQPAQDGLKVTPSSVSVSRRCNVSARIIYGDKRPSHLGEKAQLIPTRRHVIFAYSNVELQQTGTGVPTSRIWAPSEMNLPATTSMLTSPRAWKIAWVIIVHNHGDPAILAW